MASVNPSVDLLKQDVVKFQNLVTRPRQSLHDNFRWPGSNSGGPKQKNHKWPH